MSRKNMISIISGAAFGLGGVAMAATPDLDIDRAYAAELKADAALHTSLLQAGGSGHDGWFHMGDASGNNRLNIGGLAQVRYVAGFRDDADLGAGAEGFTHGFEAQRIQLRAWGHVVNPQLTYQLIWDYGNANGHHDHTDTAVLGSQLRDAWGQYNFEGEGSGWFVRWGQFVDPYLWEESVAPEYQLAVERSAVNEFFAPNWTQGAMFGYVGEGFSFKGTFTDGSRSSRSVNTGITGTGASTYNSAAEADWALTARADLKLSGDWQQFDDFTSFRGSNNAARVGGAIHWQTGGETGAGLGGGTTTDTDVLVWTIDAQFEFDGWNLYAAVIGDNVDPAGGTDTSDLGAVIQGGFFMSDQAELFARWDGLFLDSDGMSAGAEDSIHFITAGLNYYFVPGSHAAKLTTDLVYGFSDMRDVAGLGTYEDFGNFGDTGLLGGTDGELLFRAQMQLLF